MSDNYLQELYRRRDNILEQSFRTTNEEDKLKFQKELIFINEEISKEKSLDDESILY